MIDPAQPLIKVNAWLHECESKGVVLKSVSQDLRIDENWPPEGATRYNVWPLVRGYGAAVIAWQHEDTDHIVIAREGLTGAPGWHPLFKLSDLKG